LLKKCDGSIKEEAEEERKKETTSTYINNQAKHNKHLIIYATTNSERFVDSMHVRLV